MPEAPVHEDDGAVPREHEVGATGQVPSMEPKAESEPMCNSPNGDFRTGITAPDPRHHLAPPLRIHDVGHGGVTDEPPQVARQRQG